MPTMTAQRLPLVPVATAQAAVDEALAQLEDVRIGLTEIMADVRDEGGAYGPALAEIVAPFVSKVTLVGLLHGGATV